MKSRLMIGVFVLAVLALVPASAMATDANGNHDHYLFLAGVAPIEGPDEAVAPDGSTVSLSGTGEFTAGPNKSASGGGTYTIKNASGATVASGSWTVDGMLGFVSYGDGTPQGLPPNLFGGQAKLHVSLAGAGDGVLTITCLLGSPPGGADEGITLILGHGWNFTKSVEGETVFITP